MLVFLIQKLRSDIVSERTGGDNGPETIGPLRPTVSSLVCILLGCVGVAM